MLPRAASQADNFADRYRVGIGRLISGRDVIFPDSYRGACWKVQGVVGIFSYQFMYDGPVGHGTAHHSQKRTDTDHPIRKWLSDRCLLLAHMLLPY